MGTKSLIINIGSASKKYAIYEDLDQLAFFHFEKEGQKSILTVMTKDKFDRDTISDEEYESSLEYLMDYSGEYLDISKEDIFVLGFRVVAPGTYFLEDKEIDDDFMKALKNARDLDEIHVDPVLKEIKSAQKIFKVAQREGKKFFAISDSKFHNTKLEESKYYGISKKLQDENDYKRFGYHGLSAQSVSEKLIEKEGGVPVRTIIVHMGGGVSVTALSNGKSLDNTMGFSPLEGPPMATRSGDIDEVMLLDILKKKKITSRKNILNFLFLDSGIKGLSGISDNLKILRGESFKGNEDAKFAMKVYIFNVLKKISEMISVTKGVDCLVFTGTVGFRADFVRELILDQLKWLGLSYDIDKNSEENISSNYMHIESLESPIKIIIMDTDEMRIIAKNTLKAC